MSWTIKDISVGNAVQPSGALPKDEPTAYHSPRFKRTIMDGPGNRSSIIDCTCGASFDGDEYLGHDRRMCDWYAQHATIAGGGEAVAKILRQYDQALDARNYPDGSGESDADPNAIIATLRVKAGGMTDYLTKPGGWRDAAIRQRLTELPAMTATERDRQRDSFARGIAAADAWPYGPPSFHEDCCRLHATAGEGYCDCKASDASDDGYGIGGFPTVGAR